MIDAGPFQLEFILFYLIKLNLILFYSIVLTILHKKSNYEKYLIILKNSRSTSVTKQC